MVAEPVLISVIIPTYNNARFLPDAVGCVRRQNHPAVEIIIVDDGSTDNTSAVVEHLGSDIRYIYQKNAGVSTARNKGIEAAAGPIIGLLDADDVWPEDKLAMQLPLLVEDPSLSIVIGRTQAMVLGGRDGSDRPSFRPSFQPWHAPLLGSALFRKSVFEKIGGFDPNLRLGEDVDWFLRAREAGVAGVLIESVTLQYRLHGNNQTREADPKTRNLLRALKQSLDRRRSADGGKVQPMSLWSSLVDSVSGTNGSNGES